MKCNTYNPLLADIRDFYEGYLEFLKEHRNLPSSNKSKLIQRGTMHAVQTEISVSTVKKELKISSFDLCGLRTVLPVTTAEREFSI
jgi:hypothetical protein